MAGEGGRELNLSLLPLALCCSWAPRRGEGREAADVPPARREGLRGPTWFVFFPHNWFSPHCLCWGLNRSNLQRG